MPLVCLVELSFFHVRGTCDTAVHLSFCFLTKVSMSPWKSMSSRNLLAYLLFDVMAEVLDVE